MNQNTSVTFLLEGSKPNSKDQFPIKLRVYSPSVGKKKYGTKKSVTKAQWDKIFGKNLRDQDLKNLKVELDNIQKEALEIVSEIVPFSFYAFESSFLNKSKTETNGNTSLALKSCFNNYINALSHDQVGTAKSYLTTINSIESFKKNLIIHDITPKFLIEYERYLSKNNKSVSTQGIYLRQLRAVINRAIEENILSADKYPFKKFKIPAGRNIKKALTEEDLKKLLLYVPTNGVQKECLSYWLFSYLCNGINFTDIAHLKKGDHSGNFISFIREKTKRTKKKDLRPIQIPLQPKAIEILQFLRNRGHDNSYLFPILQNDITPITIKNRCQRFIKKVNKNMEEIRKELSIESKIGTYVARHTFATILVNKGVPISYLQSALGHADSRTTNAYIGDMPGIKKIEYANLLTDL